MRGSGLRRLGIAVALVALVAGLAGCSGSISFGGDTPSGVAEDLIEGELSTQLGLGTLAASCVDPGSDEVGTTFTCTGDANGQVVDFEATIDREDHVNVISTNVLAVGDLPVLEQSAVDVLNAEFDFGLAPDAIDCGSAVVVLDASQEVVCALTDPATGDVYDATMTITDLSAGLFDVVIADAPRS